MEGLGTHHAATPEQRIVGHTLVAGLSMLPGRGCPLAPQVCKSEAVALQSKIALMERFICTVEPVVGTRTPVLLDSWSCATGLWRAAHDRAFLITTGLTSNRWLRMRDGTAAQGWRGPKLSDSLAGLWEQDGVQTTSVRTLSRCHVVIVRHALSAPLSHARSWASRALEAVPSALLVHLSARWDMEVLCADGKEARGLDYSQLMGAQALMQLWTLAMLVSVLLKEEQHRWHVTWQRLMTTGKARRELQRRHRRGLLAWLHHPFRSGTHPENVFDVLAA